MWADMEMAGANKLQHTVRYSPGQCAINAIRAYFHNGTLPEPGTVCEQDFDVFSGHKFRESFFPEEISNGNGTSKPVEQAPIEFESGARGGYGLGWVRVVMAVATGVFVSW